MGAQMLFRGAHLAEAFAGIVIEVLERKDPAEAGPYGTGQVLTIVSTASGPW